MLLSAADERDLGLLTSSLLDALIGELASDLTHAAHKEIKRGRQVCSRCGYRCRGRAQLPPLPNTSKSHAASANHTLLPGLGEGRSRSSTPQPQANGHGDGDYTPNGASGGNGHAYGNGNGHGTSANGGTIKNGQHWFPCIKCNRSVISSRYAPHLASCLGLTGSTRRAATARASANNGSNGHGSGSGGYAEWGNVARGRTGSHPYAHSDSGRGDAYEDDDRLGRAGKVKGSSPMGKGAGLMKKATKTLPGSAANRSGSAPPASLLASKSRPYPLPPSKLRGASPSPSHIGGRPGPATALSTGSSLTSLATPVAGEEGDDSGAGHRQGKKKGGVKSSAIVLDDDDDEDMEMVA